MKALAFLFACCVSTAAFAVGTSRWTQTSEADWKNGRFDNVVATNLGDLKLSRAVKTLLEQDAKVSSVNALVEGPDGAIYAGTGPSGVLLRVKGDDVKPIATIDGAAAINCMRFDRAGRLLIGTGGTSGKVYRLDKLGDAGAGADAKPEEVFSSPGVQYVWAMQQTPDGNLYAATGPTGKLFEIKADGTSRVLLDTDESNLTALVSDGKDLLYVGTDPNGLVYRVNRKTGDSFVLYDAPEAEISALVLDRKGNLYAATAEAREDGMGAAPGASGEKGGRPEGGETGAPISAPPPREPKPPQLPDPTPGKPNPIPKAKPDDEAGNAATSAAGMFDTRRVLFAIVPSGAAAEAARAAAAADDPDAEPEPRKLPRPPRGPAGANRPSTRPAGVAGRQPVVEATPAEARPDGNAVYKIDPDGFVTEVFRQPVLILAMVEREGSLLIATGSEGQIFQVDPAAEETIVLAKLDPKQVTALLPATDGRIYLGTANVGGIQAMDSGFAEKGTYTSAVLDATQISRFGKMQLHGSLADDTSITVATRSGNVHDASEKGWSKWSDDATATEFLQVKSPSARFLQYRLTLASKAGKHTPIVQDVTIAYQMPNLPPVVKAVRVAGGPDAGDGDAAGAARSAGAAAPVRKLNITWDAADPNGDALTYAIYIRRTGESPWILLKDKATEPSYEWDTRAVADGRYEVKVVASDAAANVPGQGKTASRVSDPILVDNTPPVIGDLKHEQVGAGVKVSFRVVDRTGTVAGAEYAVDSSKDWQAVLPSDKIWDSPDETAAFVIPNLTAGNHQVTIRATDAKGNQAFENVFVTVQGPAASK